MPKRIGKAAKRADPSPDRPEKVASLTRFEFICSERKDRTLSPQKQSRPQLFGSRFQFLRPKRTDSDPSEEEKGRCRRRRRGIIGPIRDPSGVKTGQCGRERTNGKGRSGRAGREGTGGEGTGGEGTGGEGTIGKGQSGRDNREGPSAIQPGQSLRSAHRSAGVSNSSVACEIPASCSSALSSCLMRSCDARSVTTTWAVRAFSVVLRAQT